MGVASLNAKTQPPKYSAPLDYSFCGYRQSECRIPDVPVVVAVSAKEGDNYQRLQRLVDYVSSLTLDKNSGMRGALLLRDGVYEISQPLRISASGVVIRGESTENTKIIKTGVDRGAAIYIEGKDDMHVNDTLSITDEYVAVGKTSFAVAPASSLSPSEEVIIFRPCTKEWIESVKCNIFGGGIDWTGWKPTDMDVNWSRTIKEKNGNVVTIDAPLTVALDRQWGGCKLLRYTWKGRIEDCGVENLTVESAVTGDNPKDEDHCWDGVYIANAKNCWVRRLDFRQFAGSAVIVQRSASQITVEDCQSLAPVSEIAGFRRRSFFVLGEKCLFQRCYSYQGINDFAAGYCAPGPNAFVQCDSEESLGYSGSISSWSTGLLFDIVNIDGNDLKFCNLGQEKNGAGWNTANSTFWQCTAAELFCSSPAGDAKNYAVGSWGQFEGDGEWFESNNHVQPRSLYYSQLAARLGDEALADSLGRILPRNLNATSSPTFEEAAKMSKISMTEPRLTMPMWIRQQELSVALSDKGAADGDKILAKIDKKNKKAKENSDRPAFEVVNGKLTKDGKMLVGGRHNTPWWAGRIKYNYLQNASYAITRFVPGQEGNGLTDRIDSVVEKMKKEKMVLFGQNYGLWYDLRRDDHERIRRKDGDVWCPLYEQPFARSGQGIAWDGLSKYDLTKLNPWYFSRIDDFAKRGESEGFVILKQHYFQHNILEAGAHWVDCPWRPVNNINATTFPEPVPFTGDKRVFMAEQFYNTSDKVLTSLHRGYIQAVLERLKDNPNVIHSISAEYTGPVAFTRFWIDCVGEWERSSGCHPLIALSATKDVQDSILTDGSRAAVVDIITIEQWFYHNKGLFAPAGGANMAPRQYQRKIKTGSARFEDVYRSVAEYTTAYPDKAVMYYAQKYPENGWAVLMAGGSCAAIPVADEAFLRAVVGMRPVLKGSLDVRHPYYLLSGDKGCVVYSFESDQTIDIPAGKYTIRKIDTATGEISKPSPCDAASGRVKIAGKGVYWISK